MTAKTPAQRKAAERARKALAGISEVRGIFAPPADHAAIKQAACLALGAEAATDARIEMLEDLAKAVWMLDRSGFIGTMDDESESECAHLRGIARQTVDAYTAHKRTLQPPLRVI